MSLDFGIKRPDDFVPITDEILETTIIPHFEQIVEKYPDRSAIKSSKHSLTYRELNKAINYLAHQIVQEMGKDRSPVAFLFRDEVFSIIASMAILKVGSPYLGLHPSNSLEQSKLYLEDSNTKMLITSSDFKEAAQSITKTRQPVNILHFDEIEINTDYPNPEYKVASNDLFGIFYTSGSTGKPKGIAAGHLNKSQSTQFRNNELFISPSDHISLVTSVCFGASTTSVLGALMSGALLWVFDLKANSAQKALNWIIDEELTIFRCTPSSFRTIFRLAPKELIFSKLRLILLGGEPVSDIEIDLFKAHTMKDCVLINHYAATEVGSICHYPVHHHTPPFKGFLPAGFPAQGREILLLDDEGQPVANGQEGEIVVRSRFFNHGYWNQPELNAQKFYADPHDSDVQNYYTGDRGRWRDDGVLELLGRKDTQVKLRGYRIQLDAIDLALRSLDGVKDAATIVHKSPKRGERLVAYLSTSTQTQFSISKARKKLSSQLPEYMIPSAFIQLDALPRTASGKLARRELPEPSNERPDLETPYTAPKNKVEAQIALIWQDILELEKVGVEDNFFELGGDSLSALEMTLAVEKSLARTVPQSFFQKPTISSLTKLFETNTKTTSNQENPAGKKHKNSTKPRKTKKFIETKIKKLVMRKYSMNDFDRLVDLLVARHIVSRSHADATQWSIQWSQNSFVRNYIYPRRYTLFSQWVASLQNCQVQPVEAFQMNLLANMNFGLSRYLSKKHKIDKSNLQAYKTSSYPYWRTLGELLDKTPIGQVNEHFPINGTEHLIRAYQQGQGVILLKFHGAPYPDRFFALERFLGVKEIPTISYRIPIRQSKRTNEPISPALAAAMNSEIALFGQHQLQEGKIINFASDTSDLHGQRYRITLGGRDYQIKAGFAELALNTGAAIIPHFKSCLPDGKIQLTLGEPLQAGAGMRGEKIDRLIQEYATFIHQAWETHPEAVKWGKIKHHFALPKSHD
jgi:amino acid adenylation domain-containing protein